MADIDSTFKAFLANTYIDMPLEIEKEYTSKDGTKKFLYRLTDGKLIEGVLMNYKFGNTLCISTQIGCGRGCLFCASGADGLERNLTAGEILAQAVAVNKLLGGTLEQRKLTNIVLMGSGEPLDNYENVTKFLNLINDKNGLNISRRNISLSTCGIAPNIIRLADEGHDVTLTISLHNSCDGERKKFMPVASIYSIKEIIAAAKYYFNKTGRRIIFEYCLIKGENHLDKNVRELKELLKGFPAHLNLILLNPNDTTKKASNNTAGGEGCAAGEVGATKSAPSGAADVAVGAGSEVGTTKSAPSGGISACTRADALEFAKKLTDAGLSVTVRRQMGADIAGACGQLKGKFVGDLDTKYEDKKGGK
jgi:23S rRNA (adenine2503-C2)-methyltransferase